MLNNRRWLTSHHYSHYIIFPYFKIVIHFDFCLFYRIYVRHAVDDLQMEIFINQAVLNCVLKRKQLYSVFLSF